MTTWVHAETGEIVEGECPHCAATREDRDTVLATLERNRRADIIARAKAEKAVERDQVTRRDGATWQRIREHWQAAFPELKPTSLGIKSARATKVFLRLEAGATELDVLHAIDAAKRWRYVVYGKRRETGSKSDLAIDLEDIVAIKRDREFDFLVTEGRALNDL